jgi:hypothetical protein
MKQLTAVLLSSALVCCNIGRPLTACPSAHRQIPWEILDNAPEELRCQFLPRTPAPNPTVKRPGHYTREDWKMAIDSAWGPGLHPEIQKERFYIFWTTINSQYACFRNYDVDWVSIWNRYYAELTDSVVSRGRLAAIFNHATRALMESHTSARDNIVYYTQPSPGVPLLFVGAWGVNDHFGAALTPLPDSSLLVYRVVPDHPLGLSPGDVVLGYDGLPWKTLYRELLDAELPIGGYWWGSSLSSYTHAWLMAAGMNWHLFDTIDVVRFVSKDTVHLATSALSGKEMCLFATEQMDIPGVPMPDFYSGQSVSWGIIEGTRVGYIYCIDWYQDRVRRQWHDAIDSLMNQYETTGLIIDFRTNYGGSPPDAYWGLSLLFNTTVHEVGDAWRPPGSTDHFELEPCPYITDSFFTLVADTATFYDKPIAVLTGPGCISAGDMNALMLTYHPRVKVFGKPTSAAFNCPEPVFFDDDMSFRYSRVETYLLDDTSHFLTHSEFPGARDFPWIPFEEVWLTPEGVAAGRDDVVEVALAWINLSTNADDVPDGALPHEFRLLENYPNPFNAATTIAFELPVRSHVHIDIYNILGRQVVVLVDEIRRPGHYSTVWNGCDRHGRPVAAGVYFCRFATDGLVAVRKMLLLK